MTPATQRKLEYVDAHANCAINIQAYGDWLFHIVMKQKMETFVEMTRDNRKRFIEAWGKPHFTWVDSERRRLFVWRHQTSNGCAVYVFTHGDAGTSYEISSPKDLSEEDVGRTLIAFMKGVMFPILAIKE